MKYLDYFEALKLLKNSYQKPKTSIVLHVNESLGYTLSEDVICTKNLPCFNNAALDGYAFKYEDKNKPLKIVGCIYAGEHKDIKISNNECVKIMTGAKMPSEADTVVEFEKTSLQNDEFILINDSIKKRNAVRFCAEEMQKNSILLKKGSILNPSCIMLLATQGITHVKVYKKPKIAVISTGDEIKEIWEQADENSIYNANSSAILAILKRFGYEGEYCGAIKDDFASLSDFFVNAANEYDVIISSGGVSMGEADFIQKALSKNGFETIFHGVKIKPGRPILASKNDKCFVLSLPGNPMACFLCTYLFAIKLLDDEKFPTISAINQTSFTCKLGRTDIVLGFYENGKFFVTDENKYGSGMVKPICKSNCILLCDEQTSNIQANQTIWVIML